MQAKGSTEEALQRLSLAAVALVESRDRHGEALAWQLSAKIHLEKCFGARVHMKALECWYLFLRCI